MTTAEQKNEISTVQNNNAIMVIDENLQLQLTARSIDTTTWKVLKETVYKDAKDESILMALDYCKARKLDPLKRAVHIVPIWDSNKNCLVDTIWQGISELRTTAMRTGEYAGIDETVFGAMITKKLGNKQLTFPEWAQTTVYRFMHGQRIPFVGDKVYFEETYATLKDKKTPNSMWDGRPRGQLGKCAEANALRKAFPEELGSDYIAEEMQHITNEPMTNKHIEETEQSKANNLKEQLIAKKEEMQQEPEPQEEIIDADYTKTEEPHTEEIQENVCLDCGKTLSANELKYSTTLCYRCQQKSK